jgi:hypothetical protein
MNLRTKFQKPLQVAALAVLVMGLALTVIYILVGHGLIEAAYKSDLSIVNHLMNGRAQTPVHGYFAAADHTVLRLGLGLIFGGALCWLFFKSPMGFAFSALSFFASSLFLFLVLDAFPALIKPLHWDVVPYFNFRQTYLPDPKFGFRERPYSKGEFSTFRGSAYSPLYGIDVPVSAIRWQTDGDGFRNSRDNPSADVAVIGSSFGEYGNDYDDTYPRQLELRLGGLRVVNLSKAGYGPFQYLQTLKNHAIQKRVRIALMTFHPTSDADLHLTQWLKGIEDPGSGDWGPVAGGLFTRYTLALEQTGGILFSSAWTAVQMGFRQVMGTKFPHPEVATLGLPHGATESLVLLDPHTRKSTDELLTSPEWHAWGRILEAFKELCVENGIVPMLVYIPAATEVYAQYVLPQSGAHWLQLQNSLVATSAASEEAARRVAGKVGVEMVSLLPAYEEAARQGKMVYYAMDMHWNAEGRKIAAAFTAEAIRQRMSRPFPSTDASGLRAGQELSQLEKYSLMERTISGKIVSWNSLAEQLYGWTKEEAVGKISHELLNTRFSEPVDEINSELLENGRWEGKLDHLTRSGRRVEVKSEWVWDPKSRQSKIVEVNRPVAVADATIPDPRK